MKAVTLDGLDHYVWEYLPDWGAGVQGTFRLDAGQVSGLTKRERRVAYSESLRVELEASYAISGAEAAEARNVLRVLQDTPVRLPFLPGLNGFGEWFGARWHLAYDELANAAGLDSVGNLYWTQTADDSNGRGQIAPTLLGYFIDGPTFGLEHTELASVRVRWRESSEAAEALQLTAQSWDEGPMISGRTIYRFPFVPDFAGRQDSGPVRVEVERQGLGFSRTWSSAAYPQIGDREPRFGYTLEGQEQVCRLLQFFLERRGPVETFWLPCWMGECRLAANVGPSDTQVTVTDATALGEHRYLYFYGANGDCTRKITGINGNVLTLESVAGQTFWAGSTVLSLLALARFAGGELTVKWGSPDLARAEVQFVEVTQEYATPLGEEYGVTLGPLPAKCYLFELRHGAEVWRWTSYEKDLMYGGQSYMAIGIDFDEIVDGAAWERSSCRIRMRSSATNPLVRLVRRTATERFELIITEATPTAPVTNGVVIFRGWVMEVPFSGPWIEATAQSMGSLFKRRIPRTVMQPTDNYALFDAGNRLLKSNWTFTGRLASVSGNVFTLDTLTWPGGALPTIGAQYFTLGYIERPSPVERVPLVASTALISGSLTVTLAHELMNGAASPPENGWKLIPGYDGLDATASSKFNNLVNFGGFPEVPSKDPSLVPMPRSSESPSKK